MSLSGDLTGTSYGSGRIGMLAERAVYEGLQQRLIRQVMTPIYRNWLAMASLSGALRLPSMDVTKYYAAEWHPRVFPWIDPLKDIQGDQLEVAMGIKSLTALAAERGRDLEEVLNERSAEIKLAESLDVPLIISTGTKPKGETVDEGAPDTTEPADAADSAPTKNGKDKPGEKPAARIRLAAGGLR
jgi:capsid protein